MTKKDDLIEQAKSMNIELDSNETIADLEAKIEAEVVTVTDKFTVSVEGELKRSKVSRGSRRRIERAMARMNTDMDWLIAELDMQACITDETGNRTGEWPVVTGLRAVKTGVNQDVNKLLEE